MEATATAVFIRCIWCTNIVNLTDGKRVIIEVKRLTFLFIFFFLAIVCGFHMDCDQFSVSLANYHSDKCSNYILSNWRYSPKKQHDAKWNRIDFFTRKFEHRNMVTVSKHFGVKFCMNIFNQHFHLQTWKYYRKIELGFELNAATSLFRWNFVCSAPDLCA